jgi:4-hydroxy-3-methylbut-2-en-1-yl diphosphate synthase IspG/GcpE
VAIKIVQGNVTIGSKPTVVTMSVPFRSASDYTVTLTSLTATTTGNAATVRITSANTFEVYGNSGESLNYIAVGR